MPRADSTATTRCPASRLATMRCAARLRRSASATEVPPNFMTTVPGMRPAGYDSAGRRRRRGRVLVAAGRAVAIVAAVLLVVPAGGRGRALRAPVPEAGSRFQDGAQPRIDAAGPSPPLIERGGRAAVRRGLPGGQAPAARCAAPVLVRAESHWRARARSCTALTTQRCGGPRGASARPRPLVARRPRELGRLGPVDQPTLGAEGAPADARETARRAGGAPARRGHRRRPRAVGRPRRRRQPRRRRRSFGDDRARRGVRRPGGGRRLARGGASRRSRAASRARAPRRRTRSRAPRPSACRSTSCVARDVRPFAGVVARRARDPDVRRALRGVRRRDAGDAAARGDRDCCAGGSGFRGAVVSADLVSATAATGGRVAAAAVAALQAGCDLLLVPGGRRDQEDACARWSARCGAATSPPGGSTRPSAASRRLRRAAGRS